MELDRLAHDPFDVDGVPGERDRSSPPVIDEDRTDRQRLSTFTTGCWPTWLKKQKLHIHVTYITVHARWRADRRSVRALPSDAGIADVAVDGPHVLGGSHRRRSSIAGEGGEERRP